jgi:enhancing lycopene biosynthesis protein 2
VECFAPDLPQTEVVNCLTSEIVPGESRNMLVEAARIARGKIQSLLELRPADFSAVILPGGYGAAKNLSTFATQGSHGVVLGSLEKILREFHEARKPIGAICIAPAVVALALRHTPLELTLGPVGEAAQEVERLGHRHVVCAVEECHTDVAQRVITTPAYMHDTAPLHAVFTGIQKLVQEVVRLA